MPLTGLSSETSKLHKKSFHCRNDSDELDVFEAARYFSGYNEVAGYNGTAAYTTPKSVMREDHKHSWRGGGGRMSLDMPIRNSLPQYHHHQQSYTVEKQMLKEKKYKQPSSPGGRLASFLNSLFNQTSSKKKKSKSTTQSVKDDDESPGGRRKTRSSISHFRSSSATETKSLYSSSSSGFRTPPAPCTQTPTKGYKDFRSYSDHKQVVSLSKQSTGIGNVMKSTERKNRDLSWSDEKLKLNDGLLSERTVVQINPGNQVDRSWADQNPSEENEFRKFINDVVDDGGESDSSSDLFELQNYDLGIYSTGLPVYETTHMDSIKRGAPISNGAL